ncbi:MAG: helix-turn-helix transcriptional regulator [Lachnospiraceae bacterium]|nr:helix-turn-helix transcriptional regulator [Lachnospiraceae bacterium]
MNIGEKIKCFRQLQNMTQKKLGELTGIGEATIRKYELGIRNPKPTQLKKIAKALDIGENILLDVKLDSLHIETLGDAISLFFLLEDKLGIKYHAPEKSLGVIDPEQIQIHFCNKDFNNLLCKWIEENRCSQEGQKIISKTSAKDAERAQTIDTALLEVTKNELQNDTTPVRHLT